MCNTRSLKTIDRPLRFKFSHQSGIVPAESAGGMRTEQRRQAALGPQWQELLKSAFWRTLRIEPWRELGDCGRLKQRANAQFHSECRAYLADKPRRKQRMASKGKEIVLNPHATHAKNFTKHLAQQILHQAYAARDSSHAAHVPVWAMLCGLLCHLQSMAMKVSR